MKMARCVCVVIVLTIGLILVGPVHRARAAVLSNAGFETGDFTGWSQFGVNHYVESSSPQEGTWSLKLWQEFNSQPNNVGVFQDFAGLPGQIWHFSGYLRSGHGSGNYLGANNEAYLKIEWFDSFYGSLGAHPYNPANGGGIDSSTPQDDQWIFNYFTATNPANTAYVRATVIHDYTGAALEGGSSWFDNLDFGPSVPEPATALILLAGGVTIGAIRRKRS